MHSTRLALALALAALCTSCASAFTTKKPAHRRTSTAPKPFEPTGGAYDDDDYEVLHHSRFEKLTGAKVGKTIKEMMNKGVIPSEAQCAAAKERANQLPDYNLMVGMYAAKESFSEIIDKCTCCAYTLIHPDREAKVIMEAGAGDQDQTFPTNSEQPPVCESFRLYELHLNPEGKWKLKRMANKYDEGTSSFKRWSEELGKWWDEFEESVNERRKNAGMPEKEKKGEKRSFWGNLWHICTTIVEAIVAVAIETVVSIGAPIVHGLLGDVLLPFAPISIGWA